MSYNTRRSGYGPGVNSIGQRRPQGGNFVHGGQLNKRQNDGYQGQQYQGGQGQQHQQSRQNQSQQQKSTPPAAQQQQQPQKPQQSQQPPQQNQQSSQQQQQQQQQPRPNMQENAQALINQIQEEAAAPKIQPKTEETKPPIIETQSPAPVPSPVPAPIMETKEKPFWIKKSVRIPRAERVRRRNMRLRKVLQPKNALMVLNELVGNTAYTITDSKTGYHQDIFNATLTIEGHTFNGTGKSKVAAKTAAAEMAIKSIILKRLRNPGSFIAPQADLSAMNAEEQPLPENEDEKMDEQQQNEDLSWSHIASFAIFKLLSGWDEDEGGHLVDLFSTMNSTNSGDGTTTPNSVSMVSLPTIEQKPAKKLPENAAHLNPSMLLNQMFPHMKYEEVSRTGNPPNLQFTISCTVEGQTFTGVGQNKKAARKQAAFEACKTLLKIEYPPEVFDQKSMVMQVDDNMPF